MKISLNWLQDFVPWDGTPQELAERLTMNGLNVESVETFELKYPGVVVARVETCERHPDADKLSLCTVNDGTEVHQVVCGAPNVRAGLPVLLARVGAVLPNGMKLKKSKIRGVESRGMICSASELELSDESAGIMELPEDSTPGTPADDLYGYEDIVFDIEVTPNRPDWLSHIGVAREVAAINGALLQLPAVWSPPKTGSVTPDFAVEIDDFDDCPRYTAHVGRGVEVGPSPRWMQNRLLAIGARPINNVVDITNYVLFETGQPLHAFDLKKISGSRIIVRRAEAGETLTTLDDEERTLNADDLVIADPARAVALAGVMGGALSEVDENSTEILLESAFFSPALVRRTSRRLQLVSEASYRFEREADWDAVIFGARRALELFHKHAGVHVEAGFVDRQNPDRKENPAVTLRVEQANRLLGTRISTTEAVELLQAIGLKCQSLGQVRDRDDTSGKLMVTVPGFRRDIHEEVDLIEEVARIYGFDRIDGAAHFRGRAGVVARQRDRDNLALRRYLSSVGYSEIVTSSFMARRDLDRMGVGEDDPRREMLAVHNPQHGGETLLRPTLVPSLLHAARHNINADRQLPFRLFQMGKAFLVKGERRAVGKHTDNSLLPEETSTVQLAVVGRRDEVHGGLPAGLLEIKGALESLVGALRLPLTLEPGGEAVHLQQGMQWILRDPEGEVVGEAGAVARRCLREFEIDVPVAMAEFDLNIIRPTSEPIAYAAFPRFPAVKRDLSLVVPDGITFGRVQRTVLEAGGPLLERCDFFDLFRGESLGEGRAALGIRLKFQSAKGNLKGKAVDKAIAAITGALDTELGVALR